MRATRPDPRRQPISFPSWPAHAGHPVLTNVDETSDFPRRIAAAYWIARLRTMTGEEFVQGTPSRSLRHKRGEDARTACAAHAADKDNP